MVDFKKNETEMKGAWKEVTDNQCSTDWALFGYEGHTNNMALVSKGEDGVDELMEDLNPSKILYGFLKVDDPKTSLPKYVILNWQGETAPAQMKGKCALHLRDVQRFLPGYHLVVNVRNEDEIDMESIVKKVSEITGSSYNFKQKPQGMEHSPEPVGTAHRKINPMQELPNMAAREKFWTKDQDDEKQRVQDERERRSVEQQKAEAERRRREEKESDARDVQVKERERIMAGMKEGEHKSQEKEVAKEKSMWEKQQAEDVNEARERSQRAERMRQERATEARQLIQGASSEARKIFTRHSSQGQMGVAPALKPRTSAVNNIAAKVNGGHGGLAGKSWPPPRSNGDATSSPTLAIKKVMVEAEPSPPPPEFSTTPSLKPVPSPLDSTPAPSVDSNTAPPITESEIIPAPYIPEEPVIPDQVIQAPVIPDPVTPEPVVTEQKEEVSSAVLGVGEDLESPSIAPPPGFQGSDESRDNTVSPDYHKSGHNGKASPFKQEHRAENKTVSPYKEEISGQNGIVSPPTDYQQPSKNRSMSPDKHDQNGHQEDLHRAQPVDLDKDPVTLESYGVCAVSLYDYQASDDTEISFDPGQIITHIDQIDPGWWQGLGPDGTYGLFPANYVEIIDSSELQFE